MISHEPLYGTTPARSIESWFRPTGNILIHSRIEDSLLSNGELLWHSDGALRHGQSQQPATSSCGCVRGIGDWRSFLGHIVDQTYYFYRHYY